MHLHEESLAFLQDTTEAWKIKNNCESNRLSEREVRLTVRGVSHLVKVSQYHPRWEWKLLRVILVKPYSDTRLQYICNPDWVECLPEGHGKQECFKKKKNKNYYYYIFLNSRQAYPHGCWSSSTTTATLSPWVILRNLPQVDDVCNSQLNFLLRKSFTFAVSFSSRLQWTW